MTVVKACPSALVRQVREAVEIARGPPASLLNAKEEYNRCLLPIMRMEGPKPLRVQEEEAGKVMEPLSRAQEEKALVMARNELKRRRELHKAANPKPAKRQKHSILQVLTVSDPEDDIPRAGCLECPPSTSENPPTQLYQMQG